MSDREVQVQPDHYDFERYDDAERWMSYWHQIRVVLASGAKDVLEVGPGSGVFRSYLANVGVKVSTLDIDASRKVDYVADLTRLDETLPEGLTFDAVCAFQVLEHLPWTEFEKCVAGMARRAAPYAFISLPYRGLHVRWSMWWGDWAVSLGHKLMLPWRSKPIAEHYWELGWGHSARRINKIISRYFEVTWRGFLRENPYHYMWCLRRRPALPPAPPSTVG